MWRGAVCGFTPEFFNFLQSSASFTKHVYSLQLYVGVYWKSDQSHTHFLCHVRENIFFHLIHKGGLITVVLKCLFFPKRHCPSLCRKHRSLPLLCFSTRKTRQEMMCWKPHKVSKSQSIWVGEVLVLPYGNSTWQVTWWKPDRKFDIRRQNFVCWQSLWVSLAHVCMFEAIVIYTGTFLEEHPFDFKKCIPAHTFHLLSQTMEDM